ncbi:MAG TPA: hypothetical protein VM536_12405 [Chloroflexia bacterium]|nr:hypothetical protein [Chloroflexia bacterium]
MHGQPYLRKGIVARLNTTLEDYLWLAAGVPAALLDTVPPGATGSVRAALLALAMELDVEIYPLLIALVEGNPTPAHFSPDDLAARRAAWAGADLMVAMKQIRYRFQATEALLADTADIAWGTSEAGPTSLALAVFQCWRTLLARLDSLADLVARLYPAPRA